MHQGIYAASSQKEGYSVKEPDLKCGSGFKITRMCTNLKCKVALICSEGLCTYCGYNIHQGCASVSIEGMVYLLNQRAHVANQTLLNATMEIDDNFAKQIKKSRDTLYQQQPSFIEALRDVFQSRNPLSLDGRQAGLFVNQVKDQIECLPSKAKVSAIVQRYSKFMANIIEEISRFKLIIRQQLMGLQNYADPLQQELKNSHILAAQSQISLIQEVLSNPQKVTLLFRASQNQFLASKFHAACDGVQDTLTLVLTEFGKIIAGFTHYAWNSNYEKVNDSQKSTFLFSLSLRRKMLPISPKNLIYCGPNFGPVFGQDLLISDQCDKQRSSFANFPSNYDVPGRYLFSNNQDSYRAFSGATNGSSFKVLEYEVYKVHRRNKK